MKRMLLLPVSILFLSTAATADHIGIYADASGQSTCVGVGFQSGIAVVHKNSSGATGCAFAIQLPTGSSPFEFQSTYSFTGSLRFNSVFTVNYGTCLSSPIVVGNIVGIMVPGDGHVVCAPGYTTVVYFDCSSVTQPASGGSFLAGSTGNCFPVAVEPSTWGRVKALYR